jgi:DNA (cytosine-5)-methyltransferase 1
MHVLYCLNVVPLAYDCAYYRKKEVLFQPSRRIQSKCEICRQILDDPDLRLYQGHPDGSVEEFVALTDPKLSLFTGEEDAIHDHDQRPQNKVTHFRYVTQIEDV